MQTLTNRIEIPSKRGAGNLTHKARIKYARLLIAAVLPVVAVTSPFWPRHSLPHEIMDWAGHLLVPAGVLLSVFTSLYLGGRDNDELITWGPFSIVRNPLYVGSFLATTGLALLTGSVLITLLVAAAFATYFSATVAREEVFLRRKYGLRYQRYARRVPRWIPNLGIWDSPEELGVNFNFVLRTILIGSLFFLGIPILETLCELRASDGVPTMLTLL